MTGRERIISTLNFRQPDRVPIDFGGHRSSGIAALAYKNLRDYLGLPPVNIRVYDVIQQMAVIDDDVLSIIGTDTVEMGRAFCDIEENWKPWVLPDGSDCLIPSYIDVTKRGDHWYLNAPSGKEGGVMTKGMIYFDQTLFPYAENPPDNFDDIAQALDDVIWNNPTPPNLRFTELDSAVEVVKNFRLKTDKAIIGLFGGSFFETSQFLLRHDNCMMMMALEPKRTHILMEKLLDLHCRAVESYLSAFGPYIDIIVVSDDLGMTSGPQIAPGMYSELLKPYHRQLYKYIKKLKSGIKILLHCCGGVRGLYDDFIEVGVDAQNPVQTNCTGMEPGGLKKDFGDRITLWGGGCDTGSVLPMGTPEEVRKHVLERLEILSPNGGFVFQQVHNIVADIPPANIMSMFNAVREFNGN